MVDDDDDAADDVRAALASDPVALAVRRRVADVVLGWDGVEERVTRTQVAYRRRRGFAWVWAPRRHLGRTTGAHVVVSFALGRVELSDRVKEVAHPSTHHWIHHVELQDASDVDAQLTSWLREAWDRAG
ncbi:DUF5655 domain-containing protein [Cellulomonas carbonis]|uniref:DUF5655 domain-containing protein n=1 Tax=Cellulomonas carbonis T26 TaxID=947969 RepID=A0A0A0BTY1_9CELL|nr:DUF5655 domain-containing protein [Cellulomonas carbonis]KGM11381.1 hypothetical protein N868_10765 [Cellulomonas carbonis T26]GGC00726.1 hypothetical protein GCM10010972_11870 [Cellulomonas carbonis]